MDWALIKRRAAQRPVVRVIVPLALAGWLAGGVEALVVVDRSDAVVQEALREMSDRTLIEGMTPPEREEAVAFVAGWAAMQGKIERQRVQSRRGRLATAAFVPAAAVFLTIGLCPEIGRRRERAYPAA